MKYKLIILFSLLLEFGYLFIPLEAYSFGIELHAHLFMKEGMGWLFRGDFNDRLYATSWHDRFSSQTNPETLQKSKLSIVVATLYANPLFTRSLKDSIRKQVQLARQFVHDQPNSVLASHPHEAQVALQSGKQVMILALEGASGILESEDDLREFIDQDGITIVAPLHLTDDEFGGVAFLNGFRAFSSPIALIKSIFHPEYDTQGIRLNAHGITTQGRKLITALIKRHVWIDLAHASDASQKDILPLLIHDGQPLLYTHTSLRKYHHAERGINREQLQMIAQEGGFVGLMPSEQMLDGTPSPGTCQGSVHALATQFQEITPLIGENLIAIGSDFNGGIPHLKPSCNTGTELDKDGFWNIGQSQELWKALEKLGAWHPYLMGDPATHFLKVWTRVWK